MLRLVDLNWQSSGENDRPYPSVNNASKTRIPITSLACMAEASHTIIFFYYFSQIYNLLYKDDRIDAWSCLQISLTYKRTPWPESASELCRPNDRRLSAKLVPTFADRGCHVVSVTDPYGSILRLQNLFPLPYEMNANSIPRRCNRHCEHLMQITINKFPVQSILFYCSILF
jgi:hypothetical protein